MKLMRLMEAARVFERGRLSLTNILLVFSFLILFIFPETLWAITFGLILLSYNLKRYLAHVIETREAHVLRREKKKEQREIEEFENLKADVSAMRTQLALMNRGY